MRGLAADAAAVKFGPAPRRICNAGAHAICSQAQASCRGDLDGPGGRRRDDRIRHDQAPDHHLRHARRCLPHRRTDSGALPPQRSAGPDRAGDHTAPRHDRSHAGGRRPTRSRLRHGAPSDSDRARDRLRVHTRRSLRHDRRAQHLRARFRPATGSDVPKRNHHPDPAGDQRRGAVVLAGPDHRNPGAHDQQVRLQGGWGARRVDAGRARRAGRAGLRVRELLGLRAHARWPPSRSSPPSWPSMG